MVVGNATIEKPREQWDEDIVHLHAISGKIVVTLKWYGFQKNPWSKLAVKDPRKFGYLSQKHNYVKEGFLEEKLVH